MEHLAAGSSRMTQLTQHYDRVLAELAAERDGLQRERTALLQVGVTGRCFSSRMKQLASAPRPV